MEIKVNDKKREERLERHVEAIINKAKKMAEDGYDEFMYSITREERWACSRDLLIEVSKRTNGTVSCATKGLSEHAIRFLIRNKK